MNATISRLVQSVKIIHNLHRWKYKEQNCLLVTTLSLSVYMHMNLIAYVVCLSQLHICPLSGYDHINNVTAIVTAATSTGPVHPKLRATVSPVCMQRLLPAPLYWL